MRSTRQVGYVQVNAQHSFWAAFVIFCLVGLAFIGGIVVGQQIDSPLQSEYEHLSAENVAENAIFEVIAPGPRAELTLYNEIPDARVPATQQTPRHTVTFSHDPVQPQIEREEGNMPTLELGSSRTISASAITQ